jgi:hypothetical protein
VLQLHQSRVYRCSENYLKIEVATACALRAVPLIIVKEEGPEWGDMYQMLVESGPV